MTLTDTDCRRIAHYLFLEIDEKYGTALKTMQKPAARVLVSARVAAERLGISTSQLYRIKDNFSYIKGSGRTSSLKFDASRLVDEYQRFLHISNPS